MPTVFEKLKLIVDQSKISIEDKKELISFLLRAEEKDQKVFLDFFLDDAKNVTLVNEIYKAKRDALKNNDWGLWRKIVLEEIRNLRALEGREN